MATTPLTIQVLHDDGDKTVVLAKTILEMGPF
jgi:hypothetical protein